MERSSDHSRLCPRRGRASQRPLRSGVGGAKSAQLSCDRSVRTQRIEQREVLEAVAAPTHRESERVERDLSRHGTHEERPDSLKIAWTRNEPVPVQPIGTLAAPAEAQIA